METLGILFGWLLGLAFIAIWLIVVAAIVAIAGDVVGLWDAVEFV